MPECIEKKKLLKAIEESEPDVMADYGEYYGSEWGISRGKLYEIIANLPTLTPPNELMEALEAINNAAVAYIEGGPYENDLPGMEFALKIDRLSRDFVRPPEGEA